MKKEAYSITIHIFAGIGLLFILVYIAILLSLTKTSARQDAGVPPRLIVSAFLSEQIRLYTDSSRESFKQFFQPLSILGVQNQYS